MFFRSLQFSLSKNSIYDVCNKIIKWPSLTEGQAAAVCMSVSSKAVEVGYAALPQRPVIKSKAIAAVYNL